jgi:hypothetical protein
MATMKAAAGPAIHDWETAVGSGIIRVPTWGARFLAAEQSAVEPIAERPTAPPDHKKRERAHVDIEAIRVGQGKL